MRPILHYLSTYVPTMESRRTRESMSNYHKTSHATNFRMKSYHASERFTEHDDQEPFAGQDSQMTTSVSPVITAAPASDLEVGHNSRSIAVITEIEQEVKARP